MRTTLDIDDDVLAAAKELARVEGKTAGQVLSMLARRALTAPTVAPEGFSEDQRDFKGPVWHTLPGRSGVLVTPELVRRIQEEIDIEDATPLTQVQGATRKL